MLVVLGAALLGSFASGCKKSEAPAGAAQAPAASAAKPQVYTVHGTLKGFREGNKVVVIDHQAIPGLMEAMTMGFELADPGLAKGLAAGDKVDAVLEVSDTSFKITSLTKAGK
jgi:protein SCO1/2